ncbi:MFS transporter [Amycolatopsis sp. NBRC 101858]|uniref:MFS transporter n=1 Tax=Amycolatopsis sp. NBRC 101858 TaxID=3032200 RepID=UPI0024A2FC8B|nr:MFS transporter [Amycolatopsis sp. NBRC 101858]GLY38969.1 MFS transporter [Amycolatopsis sp. NBRC 101858]
METRPAGNRERKHPKEPVPPAARRAALAGGVGTFIEYYDYLLFSVLTVYIAPLFFPSGDPAASVLAGLAVYGAGFVAKPIGAIVFGRMGDRRGRRQTLLLTVVLMGVTTSLIAVLPTHASIGIAAPILLVVLRVLQGASSGAELQGAVTYVLESAPKSRRAGLASMVNLGTGLGGASGAFTAAVIGMTVSPQTMLTWGWRVPFLVAIPLTVLAFMVRKRLEDSPDFAELVQRNQIARSPVKDTFVTHRRILLIAILVALAYAMFGGLLGWLVPYLTGLRRLDPAPIFLTYAIGQALGNVVVPTIGRLTDRFGHRGMIIAAFLVSLLLMVPILAVLGGATSPLFLGIAITLFIALIAGSGVAIYTYIAEVFPVSARFTGSNIGTQLATAVGGGTAPLIASTLVLALGSVFAPLLVLGAAALIGVTAVLVAPRFLAGSESPLYGRAPQATTTAARV